MIYFILILLPIYCYAGDGQYECGPHGRFEYCIDGIPGCVVGCHCYPGYFFDTDTKVCEPSTKLTQEWRRYYTPIHEHGASLEAAPPARPARPTAAPTEASVLGESVKGSAELSDWLYNQFFKTIENRVINKTDEDDLLKGTRRVGGPERKPKKKRAKKEKNNKKFINHGLRRKLLRITEDDSMFESSSSSESDESDSSSSWESWDEPGGEDAGRDSLPSPAGPRKEKGDKDHGHRKIVVYNKRPKPPLPSFIFLPNVETPFYPPMGLPLPQVPMMYPMIPIPPLQAPPDCYEDPGQNSTTVAPTPKAELPAATETAAPPPPPVTTTTLPPPAIALPLTTDAPPAPVEETPGDAVANDAAANDAAANDAAANDVAANDAVPVDAEEVTTALAPIGLRKSKFKGFRGQNRNNMIQALSRQRGKSTQIVKKLGPMAKSYKVTQKNHFINADNGPLRDFNDDVYQQPFENGKPARDDALPVPDEIDFKYLSQLIHRVEGNTSVPSIPTIEFIPDRNNPKSSMRSSRLRKPPQPPGRLQAPPPARRSFDAPAAPDDAYYTNLGRQIASLIRGLQPEHAAPQPDPPETSNQPYFAENGIAPRSYWERFVRSPIKIDLLTFKKDNVLGPGSREQLYDLEDQAVVAAKSSIVLSLPEIENAIKAMSEVEKEIGHVEKSSNKPSNKSFNVSLMPRAGGKLTYTPDIPKKPLVDKIAHGVKKKNLNIMLNLNLGKKKGNSNIVPSFTRKIQAQHLHPSHGSARALNISQTNHTLQTLLRKKIAAHDFINKFLRKRINSTFSSRKPYMKVTRLPLLKYRPRPELILPNNIDQYFITRKTQNDMHTVLRGPTLKGKINRPKYFLNDFPYFD